MQSKRGLSHIEFVISFVIFVGFLVFAFVFFNPLRSERTLTSTMDYAWIEVNEETKASMETYSIVLSPTAPATAILSISGIPSRYNASVENSNGLPIPSFRDSSGVHFNVPNDNFVRIKYSPAFSNGNPIAGTPLNDGDYSVSSSDEEEIYFESLFLKLNNTYYSNYTGLKKDLNLAKRVDFGFAVDFSNGDKINALNEIPEELEVLSKEDKVKIVRLNGRIEYADIMVLAW